MMRFIGDPTLERNTPYLANWLTKIPQWINEGKKPYIFIHTADNADAPQLAEQFYQTLRTHIALPPMAPLQTPEISSQISLL